MILRKLHLENFGLFAGHHEIDLVPRGGASARPVILIGGRNGAGKTTLLEAVRLALYGKRALGVRVGQTEYDAHLRGRVSRAATAQNAAVALEFDYAEAGQVHRYAVRRAWGIRGQSVVESLSLDKDGAPVTTVPREEWHLFLQELIPPGLSQLFFFDGEKIQEIAESDDDEQLAEAVRALLGIDLVTRLRTDLGLFIARRQRGEAQGLADRLESNVRDLAVAERDAAQLAEDLADLQAKRISQVRAAEAARRRFVAEGGDAALARARIEADLHVAREQRNRGEHELRDQANRLLPFTLAPRLLGRVQERLAQQSAGPAQAAAFALLAADLAAWPDRQADWSEAHWEDLRRFASGDGMPGGELWISASGLSAEEFRQRLAEVDDMARPAAQDLLERLETLQSRIDSLDRNLKRADSAAAGVMLDELREASERVGASDTAVAAKEEALRAARHLLLTLQRERKRLLEAQTKHTNAVRQEALAVQAAQALADYEVQLLELRVQQLRTQFLQCFAQLARKPGMISDVRIDPESFVVSLIGPQGAVMAKSALSAGEKQIYATAILWALARTSGRQLPMIIDTPLARLDAEHRARLVGRYFPAASHQVILLSTDTEIDGSLLETLTPSISHAYRLTYEPETSQSQVSVGYFASDPVEAPHALQQA